jgi:hypothetical protein
LRELKKATGGEDHKETATLPAATAATVAAAPVAPIAPVASVAPTPINAAPTVAARACPSCRGSVPVGDKFCGNCGATMEAVSRSA